MSGRAGDPGCVKETEVVARVMDLPERLFRWAFGCDLVGGPGQVPLFGLMTALRSATVRLGALGANRAVLVGWVGLVAGAPTGEAFEDVSRLLRTGPESDLAAWLALGDLGPLAYAAGLPLAEGVAGLAAGTLDRDGLLLVVAGLRGWVFPPEAVLSPLPPDPASSLGAPPL